MSADETECIIEDVACTKGLVLVDDIQSGLQGQKGNDAANTADDGEHDEEDRREHRRFGRVGNRNGHHVGDDGIEAPNE